MINLEHASKVYRLGDEEIFALDNLSLAIGRGEFVAVVGPSGSGKSTLMNVVGALDSLTDGTVTVAGKEISSLRDAQKAQYRRKTVGFVFQTFNLQGQLSALENVEFPLLFDNVTTKMRREFAEEAIERVALVDRMNHRPSELSGGQQQRVAIARALVNHPKILLADEPTGNLDSKSGNMIMKLLKSLNEKEKVTVVMVTHNEAHAAYTNRVLHMRDGRVVDDNVSGKKK